MNNKQRDLIVDAFINHQNNGYRSDPSGDYVDTSEFFKSIFDTDEKLEKMAIEARKKWAENS